MLALLKRSDHATGCIALLETAMSPVECNFLNVSKLLHFTLSDHSTQAIHARQVAKTRFVTVLSTKVLNTSEELSWLQRRVFDGVVPHNRAICPTGTQLLRF